VRSSRGRVSFAVKPQRSGVCCGCTCLCEKTEQFSHTPGFFTVTHRHIFSILPYLIRYLPIVRSVVLQYRGFMLNRWGGEDSCHCGGCYRDGEFRIILIEERCCWVLLLRLRLLTITTPVGLVWSGSRTTTPFAHVQTKAYY
jgi:hypothetical protein